jgi:hypothetical protein
MQSASRGFGPASRCKAALIVRVEFSETACERASGATAAPSGCHCRIEKCVPPGGGLRNEVQILVNEGGLCPWVGGGGEQVSGAGWRIWRLKKEKHPYGWKRIAKCRPAIGPLPIACWRHDLLIHSSGPQLIIEQTYSRLSVGAPPSSLNSTLNREEWVQSSSPTPTYILSCTFQLRHTRSSFVFTRTHILAGFSVQRAASRWLLIFCNS